MIRQAISCDMCGAEMQRTNHWFVAIEQNGELRMSGWTPRSRLRAGAKHLCGQTCLHKLVDEFVAYTASGHPATQEKSAEAQNARPPARRTLPQAAHRPQPAPSPGPEAAASLNFANPTYIDEFESSARLIPTPASAAAHPSIAPGIDAAATDDPRNWRAEAWKREREREQRQNEHRTKPITRRRSIA